MARNGYPIAVEGLVTAKDNPDRVFFPEAGAKYNAKGPTNITLGAEATTVVVGQYGTGVLAKPGLSLGNWLAPPASFGIHFTFTASAPDTGGYVTGTQLINNQSTYTPVPADTGKVFHPTGGAFWLDACWFYPGADPNLGGFGLMPRQQNGQFTYVAYDSPVGFLYNDFSSLIRDDSFRMYFMYRPSGPESIWVPLGMYLWSWGGTAVFNTPINAWTLTSSHQSTPGFGGITATFPTWSETEYFKSDCPGLPAQ